MTTKEEFCRLADSEDRWERLRAARAKRTPGAVLARLAYDEDYSVKYTARTNPRLPLETIGKLLREALIMPSSSSSLAITRNPSLTPEHLTIMHSSPFREVFKYEIYSHPNCPVDILREGVAEDNPYARGMAAGHKNLPEDAWGTVLGDPAPQVRVSAVRNPSIPAELVAGLINDPSLRVLQQVVKKTSGETQKAATVTLRRRSKSVKTRQILAGHVEDPDILDGLSMDALRSVRRRAAGNENAREEARVAAALLGL